MIIDQLRLSGNVCAHIAQRGDHDAIVITRMLERYIDLLEEEEITPFEPDDARWLVEAVRDLPGYLSDPRTAEVVP